MSWFHLSHRETPLKIATYLLKNIMCLHGIFLEEEYEIFVLFSTFLITLSTSLQSALDELCAEMGIFPTTCEQVAVTLWNDYDRNILKAYEFSKVHMIQGALWNCTDASLLRCFDSICLQQMLNFRYGFMNDLPRSIILRILSNASDTMDQGILQKIMEKGSHFSVCPKSPMIPFKKQTLMSQHEMLALFGE